MDMFRSLLRPRAEITIPQFDSEDKVDLLVKSLFYMYRRLDLLAPSAGAGASSTSHEVDVDGLSPQDLENLDKMYNKTAFVRLVYQDKHRVLTDWPRNKFRSLLILSHTPQMNELPIFPEPGFRFVVLSPESSNDEYVKTLTESDIYLEHRLPPQVRSEIVESLLRRHPGRDLLTRSVIIAEYVQLLAIEVQVARLYKAALSERGGYPLNPSGITSPVASPMASPAASPFGSPGRHPQISTSPVREPRLTNKPSLTLPSDREPRLRAKPSFNRTDPEREPERENSRDGRAVSTKPSLSGLRLSPTLRQASPPRSPSPRLRTSRSASPLRPDSSPTPERRSLPSNTSPSQVPSPGNFGRKLRLKDSTQNLRGSVSTQGLRDTPNLSLTPDPKKVLLDQSRLAVQARLMREEQIIQNI